MIGLALKMLFGDTAKYLMLVAGLFFATFLIVQQASVFAGLMRWTTSTLKNVAAPIYVVEERVEQINEINPMRDTDVARVRSVSSVRWAMPLYSGYQRARLADGSFKMVQLIGIDAASLAGAPQRMVAGNLEDLRLPNTVVVDELAIERLSLDPKNPAKRVKVGDIFEINDVEARVVGICSAMRSFTGGPYIWTTYERALQYTPPQRKMLSAVIAAPAEGKTIEETPYEDVLKSDQLKNVLAGNPSQLWVQLVGRGESPFRVRPGQRANFTGRLVPSPPGFAERVGMVPTEGAALSGRQAHHIEVAYDDITLEP